MANRRKGDFPTKITGETEIKQKNGYCEVHYHMMPHMSPDRAEQNNEFGIWDLYAQCLLKPQYGIAVRSVGKRGEFTADGKPLDKIPAVPPSINGSVPPEQRREALRRYGTLVESIEKAKELLDAGYNILYNIIDYYIVFDIDDLYGRPITDEDAWRIANAYQTTSVRTPKGVHIWFSEFQAYDMRFMKGRFENHIGRGDIRSGYSYGWIILPNGIDRTMLSNCSVRMLSPEFLITNKNMGKSAVGMKDGEGRDDFIFRYGRALVQRLDSLGLRDAGSKYREECDLKKAIRRIDRLFAEPHDDNWCNTKAEHIEKCAHQTEYIKAGYEYVRKRGDIVYDGEYRFDPNLQGDLFNPFSMNPNQQQSAYEGGYADYINGEMQMRAPMNGYEVNPFTVLKTVKQLKAEYKPRQSVWNGIAKEGDVVLVVGDPKGGKSTLMRSVALSISNGGKWLGETKHGWVLWYAFEENPSEIAESLTKAEERYGLQTNWIRYCVMDTRQFAEPSRHFIQAIREICQSTEPPPTAIVVDTVGHLMSGVDINDYITVQRFIEQIRWALRDIDNPPAVFLLHHTNKGGTIGAKTPLGSTSFQGSVDVIVSVDNDEGDVSMTVKGRGVQQRFNKPHRLVYDAEADMVTSLSVVNYEFATALKQIIDGEIKSVAEFERRYPRLGGLLKKLISAGAVKLYQYRMVVDISHEAVKAYLDYVPMSPSATALQYPIKGLDYTDDDNDSDDGGTTEGEPTETEASEYEAVDETADNSTETAEEASEKISENFSENSEKPETFSVSDASNITEPTNADTTAAEGSEDMLIYKSNGATQNEWSLYADFFDGSGEYNNRPNIDGFVDLVTKRLIEAATEEHKRTRYEAAKQLIVDEIKKYSNRKEYNGMEIRRIQEDVYPEEWLEIKAVVDGNLDETWFATAFDNADLEIFNVKEIEATDFTIDEITLPLDTKDTDIERLMELLNRMYTVLKRREQGWMYIPIRYRGSPLTYCAFIHNGRWRFLPTLRSVEDNRDTQLRVAITKWRNQNKDDTDTIVIPPPETDADILSVWSELLKTLRFETYAIKTDNGIELHMVLV